MTGFDLDVFSISSEVSACVVSCNIVCGLTPVAASILIVLVLGSNRPATEMPPSFFKLLTTSTLVSPNFRPNFLAISATRLLGDVAARASKAPRISPLAIAERTDGSTGRSRPTTASAAKYFLRE